MQLSRKKSDEEPTIIPCAFLPCKGMRKTRLQPWPSHHRSKSIFWPLAFRKAGMCFFGNVTWLPITICGNRCCTASSLHRTATCVRQLSRRFRTARATCAPRGLNTLPLACPSPTCMLVSSMLMNTTSSYAPVKNRTHFHMASAWQSTAHANQIALANRIALVLLREVAFWQRSLVYHKQRNDELSFSDRPKGAQIVTHVKQTRRTFRSISSVVI